MSYNSQSSTYPQNNLNDIMRLFWSLRSISVIWIWNYMSIVKDVAFLFLHTLFANAFNDPKNSKKKFKQKERFLEA